MSTHEPLHRSGAPAGQPHTPDVQLPPTAHLVVQLPQWVASLARVVQASVHMVLLESHLHVPALQVCPGKHA